MAGKKQLKIKTRFAAATKEKCLTSTETSLKFSVGGVERKKSASPALPERKDKALRDHSYIMSTRVV